MIKFKFICGIFSLLLVSNSAFSNEYDKYSISAGWLNINPQGDTKGVNSVLMPDTPSSVSISDPNSGYKVQRTDALGLFFNYYINPNVSLEVLGGIPPRMDVKAEGLIMNGSADLTQFDKILDVKVTTPAVMAKYHYGRSDTKFRPYIGAGILYANFSDVKINPQVNNYLSQGLGQNTYIKDVDVDNTFAPIFTLGFDYNITRKVFVSSSVSYSHLNTKSSIVISQNGVNLIKSDSKVDINPIVTYLGLGYRF
ncbi:OmpW family outer membrane protein [Acinetobacter baumannii]|uniref:OmpW/AlkL family protein n=1 Tax=Acinetobacter baumannii TaxID=470 RepID=UPI00233F5A3A|nr:outer membrane beta-barrel protein [Acinetobacter baumannii]